MADGVDVPIKLPTDTSGPKAGAAAVKGLLDSLNAMGEAGAKGGKKAQQAVIGVATAAAKAQVAVEKTAAQEAAKAATAQAKAAAKAKNDAALSAQKHAQKVDSENQKSFLAHQSAAQKHAHDIHKKRVDQEIAEEKRAAKEVSKAHRDAAKATAKERQKIQKGSTAQSSVKSANRAAAFDAVSGAVAQISAMAIAAAAAIAAITAAFSAAVVKAQVFKEATLGALAKLLGGAGAANKAFKDTIKTADKIGVSYEDALKSVNSLVAKGFKADQAQELVKAMADLKSVSPEANVQGLLLAIGQIKGKGVLQMEELQGQISEHGLAVNVVLEEIGKKIGKSSAEVRKMISAGKISADQGIQGILAAIQKTTGKPIGKAAEEASKSLGGLINRLQQIPGSLLLMADASKGMGILKDVFSNILAAVGPGTKGGEALAGAIGNVADALAGVFTSLTGAQGKNTLETFALGIAAAMNKIAAGIRFVSPYIPTFLKGMLGLGLVIAAVTAPMIAAGAVLGGVVIAIVMGLGKLVSGVMSAYEWITSLDIGAALGGVWGKITGAISSAATTVLTAATSIGTNLIAGIIAGITGGLPGLLGVIAQVATTTTAAGQSGYQVKSPSKLWEKKIGYQLPAGEAKGIERGTPLVNRAIDKMAGQTTAHAAGGGGGTAQGGGGRSVSIGQIGPFYARTERDALAIAREVRRELRAALLEIGFTPAVGVV
jgi:tape measure domain-containing protein